jgi:membrane-associated phospholipid phosphatase
MKISISLFIAILFLNGILQAQENPLTNPKVYRMNYSTDVWTTGILSGLSLAGVYALGQKKTLSVEKVNNLSKKDIFWSVDRNAVRQSFPAPSNVYNLTDIGLYGASAMVPLLLLDDAIRDDWLDIGLLFIETQAINVNIYFWGGPVFTKRIRPIVYYKGTALQTKTGKDMTDSFFSGHVSITAGATFFMAKVYSDYHPELGAKKWWLFAAAAVPPALVGYGRYRGMMHFPSDILLGYAIGTTLGILVPQLHKIVREENPNLSILPFSGEYSGLMVTLRF